MRDPSLPIPKGIRREVQSDRVILGRSWRTHQLAFLILFTILWDGMLIGWYYTAFTGPKRPLMANLFPLVHVAVGLGFTYYCIAALFNTTELEISPDTLRVTTKPVPWHREIRLATAEICDVIYRERARRGYASTYDVAVVNLIRQEKLLITQLTQYEEAVFYVRELRSLLGLPDTTLSPDV